MAVDDIYIDVSGCVSTNDSTNAPKMLISDIAVNQQHKVKPLVKTGTFVYNVKVIGGQERSKLPDLVYSYHIIMKPKRSKEEQFVIELCLAFAKYGVSYDPFENEKVTNFYLRLRMHDAIDENWNDIFEMSKKLEQINND